MRVLVDGRRPDRRSSGAASDRPRRTAAGGGLASSCAWAVPETPGFAHGVRGVRPPGSGFRPADPRARCTGTPGPSTLSGPRHRIFPGARSARRGDLPGRGPAGGSAPRPVRCTVNNLFDWSCRTVSDRDRIVASRTGVQIGLTGQRASTSLRWSLAPVLRPCQSGRPLSRSAQVAARNGMHGTGHS